jgi:DNA-binding SARP family transcriptional activator
VTNAVATQEVDFRVLGRLAVSVGGSAVPPPRSPILQGLLGVLVLARGEALPISRLAELVWTDRASETSREAVHVGVSRLRKWLTGIDGGRSGQVTIRHADGYLLECPAARSDLGRFLALAGEARSLVEPDERYRALSSAFAERKGPLLAGLPRIDRTDPLVRGAEDGIRQAAIDLSAAALEAGVSEGAVATVGALAEELHFDEALHAALIDLLAASGRRAEALHTYRRLSDYLEAELGIEPSEEVRLAHMRVLTFGGPRAGPATAPETPAPPPAAPVPAQLPPDVPDFTGRAAEAAELARVLTRGAGTSRQRTMAIATVAGMAGLGKTTLAVHVAHRIAGSFPAGQLYADLHGDSVSPSEPVEVLGGFLRTLSTAGEDLPASLDERMALYRSRLAGRRMLIVLDNAAGEDQVRPLLPGAPDAAVLVTGRSRLIGLEGAQLLNLDVLPSAQAVELIANIVGERRVAREPAVAVEIARLCGHVPLAVRIAAARLLGRRHWTLSHLAGVLFEERRRLDELVAGDLEVRAGFALSYRLLSAGTRRAFRAVGLVNAPDFAAWTVAALLDGSVAEAQRHLELLIDAQLVGVAGTDETGQLRYKPHDLLRLYARERAEREDSAALRAAALHRALGAWLALAEEAAERLSGPCYAAIHGSAPRWPLPVAVTERLLADPLRWFTAERAALVAEVSQACDLLLTDFAWDLAASVEKYHDVRGTYDDWRRMQERALTLCRETGDRLGEAVLLRGLLDLTMRTSPAGSGPAVTRSRRPAEELLDLFTDLGDPIGMADAMIGIVWGRITDGETAEALALAEHALRVARAAGYPGGQARAYHVMAAAHGENDPHAAAECLEQALVIAKRLGHPGFLATIAGFLGAAHRAVASPVA